MGASDYQLGYQAYFNNEPFDDTRSNSWQNGWLDAEVDGLDSYDYYPEELGDY